MGKDPTEQRKAPVLKPIGLDASYVAPKPVMHKAPSRPDTTLRASIYSPVLCVVQPPPARAPEKKNWTDSVGERTPKPVTHVAAVKQPPAVKFVNALVAKARRHNLGNFKNQDESQRFLAAFETAANSIQVRTVLETSPLNENRYVKTLWKSFKHAIQHGQANSDAGSYDFMFYMKPGDPTLKHEIAVKISSFSRRQLKAHRSELTPPIQRMAAE